MANLNGFDAGKVEPNTGFDCVPAGSYDVVIVGSEMKKTKDGAGQYLSLDFQILNGPYQNKHLFTNLNLVNANAKAVEIAKGNLSAICRAVGVLTPGDSAELHGKPLTCTVTIRKSEEYGDSNEVKSFKPRGSVPAASAAPIETAPWAK